MVPHGRYRALVHGIGPDHVAGLALARGASSLLHRLLFIVTFVFGAAVTSTAALAFTAPSRSLPLGLGRSARHFGFVIVGIGRYELFERIMKGFAALKFGAVVLLAILLAPNLGELASASSRGIPGGLLSVLAIIGGVGGTYSLAAYATGCASAAGATRPGSP